MTSPIIVAFREEHREALDAFFDDLLQLAGDDLGVRFDDHLAGFGVDDVVERDTRLQNRPARPRPCPSSAGAVRRSPIW